MKKGSIFCVAVLFLLWILLLPLYAKEFYVSSSEEFQDALYEAASNGESDTIYVAEGVYFITETLKYYGASYNEEASLNIVGAGSNTTILDGMGTNQILAIYTGFPNSRITITLSGLCFTNGRGKYSITSTSHGALHIEGHNTNVVLEDCKFENNSYIGTTENGVGLCIETTKSSITVKRCIFTNNSASWCGGAANIWGDNVILKNNVFQNNSAVYGGGLYVGRGHQVYLEYNLFENNIAEFGGGAYIASEEAFLIGNSFFHNRQIVSSGYGYGGGCYLWKCYDATFVNNVFHDNTSGYGGGVFLSAQELTNVTLTITNNTFVYNSSTSHGGGLFVSLFRAKHTLAQIYNNLIWGNQSLSGSDLFINATDCELTAPPEIKVYNNLYNDFAADTDSYVSIFQENNIVSDPILVENFHLSSTSPCIDAGTNDAPGLPDTDFEGDPRIVGAAPDIGADEYTEHPTPPPNQPPVVTFISQYQPDGTQIPEGSIIPEGTIVFKATLEDPDGDDVRLEIELRKIDEPFTGEPTSETTSDFVPSGSEVTITRSGLVDGDYHWQYRVKDSKGAVSEWKEFGKAGDVDFEIENLLAKYAPVLYLYPDDFYPKGIESMLDHAELWKWGGGTRLFCSAELISPAPISNDQLKSHDDEVFYLDLVLAKNKSKCDCALPPNPRLWDSYDNVVYGRLYKSPKVPDKIVLQYWFFYPFNDFKNDHEGDWEMIQIILDKNTEIPESATYAYHDGGETFQWKDIDKIEDKITGEKTHPKVFVARGSHASYATPGTRSFKVIKLLKLKGFQDETTANGIALYPERVESWLLENVISHQKYKLIPIPPTCQTWSVYCWSGFWGKRVGGVCFGCDGARSPGKQGEKWENPIKWAKDPKPLGYEAAVGSPVHLHAYDQYGNHVGLTKNGEIEATIPGTYLYIPSEEDSELMIILTSEDLTFSIESFKEGNFDFGFSRYLGEGKEIAVTYKNVSVTENTVATVNTGPENPNFVMDVDINGDGEVDFKLRPTSVIGITGDLDHDGDIDMNDLNVILSYRNQEATTCPECDLDGDGIITVLDARKLVLMCTRPGCAIETF